MSEESSVEEGDETVFKKHTPPWRSQCKSVYLYDNLMICF